MITRSRNNNWRNFPADRVDNEMEAVLASARAIRYLFDPSHPSDGAHGRARASLRNPSAPRASFTPEIHTP